MDKKDIVKEYSNGEVTVVWRPSKCIHSAKCWKGEDGLLSVFDPTKRPWVNPEGATSERIVEQIKKCPSGALDFYYNDNGESKQEVTTEIDGTAVQVLENGPLIIKGDVVITLPDGSTESKEKMCALCRCGASSNKPYCDGSHKGMTL